MRLIGFRMTEKQATTICLYLCNPYTYNIEVFFDIDPNGVLEFTTSENMPLDKQIEITALLRGYWFGLGNLSEYKDGELVI